MDHASTDTQRVAAIKIACDAIKQELSKRIVGQKAVIDDLLACFFAGGHCLIVGVPGLAKTTLVHCLAQCFNTQIQPHPIHARSYALRYHGIRNPFRRQGKRPARIQIRQGPYFL